MRTSLKLRLGKGFTLIELLIVITIIGILAVALVPRISQGPAKARDVTRKADIGSISTALEFYFSDNSAYPAGAVGTAECISTSGTANVAIAPFMKGSVVPTDPTTNGVSPCVTTSAPGYGYKAFSATSYVVAALLETQSGVWDNIYCAEPTAASTLADLSAVPYLCTTSSVTGSRWYGAYQ